MDQSPFLILSLLLCLNPKAIHGHRLHLESTNYGPIPNTESLEKNTPIKLSVYYETLCPDSLDFLERQLLHLQNEISEPALDSVANIKLIPYGKAVTRATSGQGQTPGPKTPSNPNDKYKFICQHGPVECEGNKLHTCALNIISKYPEIKKSQEVKFLICTMKSLMDTGLLPSRSSNLTTPSSVAMDYCIKELDLSQSQNQNHNQNPSVPTSNHNSVKMEIEKCIQDGEGSIVLKNNGELTQELNPKLYFVPWVTFNGIWSKQMMEESLVDLRKVLCQLITTNPSRSSEPTLDYPTLGCQKYYAPANAKSPVLMSEGVLLSSGTGSENSRRGGRGVTLTNGGNRNGPNKRVNIRDRRGFLHSFNNDGMDTTGSGWRVQGNMRRDWGWRRSFVA